MTDDELRALARAASDRDADWLPARFNLGMEFATILALLDRLAAAERERDEAVREKVQATQTAQRLAAERDEARGLIDAMAAGYTGSVMTGDADGGCVSLFYETSDAAEQAHDAWADRIDAALAKGE